MYKITFIIFFIILLGSCSNEDIIITEEKKDFFVEIKSYSDFDNSTSLEKTGKISSSQDIQVLTNANGRVANIYVKQGDYVSRGNIIAVLDDNIANYGLNLDRAENSLGKAKLNYETVENQLNKNISDLKINLKNLKIDELDSKSSLELEKVENSIKKIALDFDNLKISNTQTINGFNLSIEKEINTLSLFLDDIIDFSDKLLGVTIKNSKENDSFETFLGAKNISQKNNVENLLKELIIYRESAFFDTDISKINSSDFANNMDNISNGYLDTKTFLSELEITLDNSLISVGRFSEVDKSKYKISINIYQSTYNLNNGIFIGLKNQVNIFLETYLNKEESLLKQIELLESDKKIFIKGLDIKLNIDESTLQEAISNKNLTLKNIERLIIDAEISYKQAKKEYNKLTIKSPISGVIGEVFIDLGQEINIGTPITTVSSTNNNEVTISFNKKELDLVSIGMVALLDFEGESYTGTIYSISKTADKNLKYISRISFPSSVNLIGNIVSVSVPVKTTYKLIPINILKIKESGIGTVNVLESEDLETDENLEHKIVQKDISLGKIYQDKIEVLSGLDNASNLILNYVGNYDEEKFILKIK